LSDLTKDIPSRTARPSMHTQDDCNSGSVAKQLNACGLIRRTRDIVSFDTRSLQRSLGGSILYDHQDSRQDMHPWDGNQRIRHGTQTRNSSRVGYRQPLFLQQLSGSSLTGGSFYHLVAAPSKTGGFSHRTVFRCKKTRLFVGPLALRACLELYF
jgi:hypothetical protein